VYSLCDAVGERLNRPVERLLNYRRLRALSLITYLLGYLIVLLSVIGGYGTESLIDRTEVAIFWMVAYFLFGTAGTILIQWYITKKTEGVARTMTFQVVT
jgi:hypothetical protein